MHFLIDTGVLLRSVSVDDPARIDIQDTFRRLLRQGHQLVTSTQNIREFWNVTTRPMSARGGYGQPLGKVIGRVRYFERFLQVVAESPLTIAFGLAWSSSTKCRVSKCTMPILSHS